jgi:hypothetical protein
MYYENTIAEIKARIETVYPGTESLFMQPIILVDGLVPLSYLLWMCNELQTWDTKSIETAVRAGRWIGWISAHFELHSLMKNNETRDMVREDREQGLDKPHPL